jgi:hypothetical protein
MATPDITGSGGYTLPSATTTGFASSSQNIPYYQGLTRIQNIPDYQRDYNIRDALILRIKEGRDNMMRLLLADAKRNGAYVVTDVQHRWPVEAYQHGRFYLKTMAGQGNGALSNFTLAVAADSARLQPNDIVAFMGAFVEPDRKAKPVYTKSTTSGSGAFIPEVMKIVDVNVTTGVVRAIRNFTPSTPADQVPATTFEVVASGATGAQVNAENAFFVKMGNSMAEGKNDQKIWSRTGTWDYNTSQFLVRKWGATDIEQKVARRMGTDGMNTMQRNRQDALEQFYDELEWLALFGQRGEGVDAEGRWQGYAGGILEIIPKEHYEVFEGIDYTSNTKFGDFTTIKFNKKMENKFFFGNQTKVLLCGQNFHTAFTVMINQQTQAVPTILDSWQVKGYSFTTSTGGTLLVTPSDKMSLNGMSDYALMIDMEYFRYGHLDGFDINIIDKLVSQNPHEDTGELYGVITFYRGNPYAHWVFTLKANAGN